MAGRRYQKAALGRPVPPKRSQVRQDRMSRLIAVAATPEQRLAATYDALRSAARRSPGRGPQALAEAQSQLARLLAWVTEREIA